MISNSWKTSSRIPIVLYSWELQYTHPYDDPNPYFDFPCRRFLPHTSHTMLLALTILLVTCSCNTPSLPTRSLWVKIGISISSSQLVGPTLEEVAECLQGVVGNSGRQETRLWCFLCFKASNAYLAEGLSFWHERKWMVDCFRSCLLQRERRKKLIYRSIH